MAQNAKMPTSGNVNIFLPDFAFLVPVERRGITGEFEEEKTSLQC